MHEYVYMHVYIEVKLLSDYLKICHSFYEMH